MRFLKVSAKEKNSIHFKKEENYISSIKTKPKPCPETVFLFTFFVTENFVSEKRSRLE